MELPSLPELSYKYITSSDEALRHLEFIERHERLEVDTETTGLDPLSDRVVLLQIGVPDGRFVFDVRDGRVDANIFKRILENKKHLKFLHNARFDYKMLKTNFGISIKRIYDTMIIEQLIYLGLKPKASLQFLIQKYLHMYMPKDAAESFKNYSQEYQPFQLKYAANDVGGYITEIYNQQVPMLKERNLLRVAKLELDFIKPLADMELRGIKLDVPAWRKLIDEHLEEKNKYYKELSGVFNKIEAQSSLFGVSLVNVDSPKQLIKSLRTLGIPVESTDTKELSKYAKHPVVSLLLNYRGANKFVTTYGESLIEKINPKTGRLHTDFQQMVDTGRLSSRNPNLQNIPHLPKYRSCFITEEGCKLITSDLSGAELRIIAAMSKEPKWLEIFKNNLDLHTISAAYVFGITEEEVLRDKELSDSDPNKKFYRDNSKPLSFGLCLHEDTQLLTNKGILKIKDSNVMGSDVAYDVGNNKAIDHKYMGEKDVYELTSQFGYSLDLTEDHVIKVINKEGDYVDKCLKDIDVENDYVCIKKGSNLFTSDLYKFDEFDVKENTNFIDINLPTVLTEDVAALLGLFISEGSLHKNKKHQTNYSVFSVTLSNKNEFVNITRNLLKKFFVDRLTDIQIDQDRTSFRISSVKFGEWLKSICGDIDYSVKSSQIDVPTCILQSPKHIQASFMRWLFEGDGSVKTNNTGYYITYSSKSKKLMKTLQLMLLNFGIVSSIYSERRVNYPEVYYVLNIIGSDSRRIFCEEINFLTERKRNRCSSNVRFENSTYVLPNQTLRLECMKYKILGNKDRKVYDTWYNCIHILNGNVGNIGLSRLCLYDAFFNMIHTNGITPLKIKSISPKGKLKVYDISVDEHQYFLANGFVVHNCYGLSAVGLSVRLGISKEAAQNMIDAYFKLYPTVKRFLDYCGKFAITNGYSLSISGRRRYYRLPTKDNPDFNKIKSSIERQGKNHPIQGGNGDVLKQSIIMLDEKLEDYPANIILNVHDEMVVESKEEVADEIADIVSKTFVEGFAEFFKEVPMVADAFVRDCWSKK